LSQDECGDILSSPKLSPNHKNGPNVTRMSTWIVRLNLSRQSKPTDEILHMRNKNRRCRPPLPNPNHFLPACFHMRERETAEWWRMEMWFCQVPFASARAARATEPFLLGIITTTSPFLFPLMLSLFLSGFWCGTLEFQFYLPVCSHGTDV
jgi:hypothetical protein